MNEAVQGRIHGEEAKVQRTLRLTEPGKDSRISIKGGLTIVSEAVDSATGIVHSSLVITSPTCPIGDGGSVTVLTIGAPPKASQGIRGHSTFIIEGVNRELDRGQPLLQGSGIGKVTRVP